MASKSSIGGRGAASYTVVRGSKCSQRLRLLSFLVPSRYDGLSSTDDFQTFHHRGKAFAQWKLHGDFEAVASKRGQRAAEEKSD